MVVMNPKGEVVIAHHGKKELRVKFCKDGIRARSELGYKSFYLYNKDMYIRSTDKGYVTENMQFALIRIERFLINAINVIGAGFEENAIPSESHKAAVLLMQNVSDTKMTSIERWADFDKKVERLGGWFGNW
ncbi:hypothetical protein [Ruminococcus albus]|uniref:Uncharacterized protein n=1 Tax=Ruminococcus albus (strain ATCC 27210 / DSM 20455 / JCM 14654 / NCDO 2250 / 7) TaxID=697329 RepID=E6UD45_RUMA7|nr:hypothetical protein [Ruminococcus albus]ADU21650.1 hypothetical protein Rumal_1125 [Ruminococcus albus 7 = DSM 20455]